MNDERNEVLRCTMQQIFSIENLLLGAKYPFKTRSISCPLIFQLLGSPDPHQPWYSYCKTGYALRFHDYLVTRFWLYKDTLIIFLSVFVSLPTEIATSHVKLKVTCMAIPFQVRIPFFVRFGAVVFVLGVSVSPTIGREVCPISPGPGSRLTT